MTIVVAVVLICAVAGGAAAIRWSTERMARRERASLDRRLTETSGSDLDIETPS